MLGFALFIHILFILIYRLAFGVCSKGHSVSSPAKTGLGETVNHGDVVLGAALGCGLFFSGVVLELGGRVLEFHNFGHKER